MANADDRLIRYLDDAWAVEKALVAGLDRMAGEVQDETVRNLFAQHRDLTHQQEEALEARIRALGEEPSGSKGFFSSMMARLSELTHAPHDEYDRVTQDLMKQFGIENFEIAMYQSLMSYANAIGDQETANLARQNMEQERQTADQVWQLIEPCSIRPAKEAGRSEDVSRAA